MATTHTAECTEKHCPVHGHTLMLSDYQGDELEWRDHLECSVTGCDYETRA